MASSVLIGCGDSQSQMTSHEASDFKGSTSKPMTDAKKQAMKDFQEQFAKLHPSEGPPKLPNSK